MHGFGCREGFDDVLAHELARGGAHVARRFARLLVVEATDLDPAFASRSLPDARIVESDSVSKLARGTFEEIAPLLDAHASPWTISTFATDEHTARARLVEKELRGLLKEKLKRAFRRLGESGDVLQVALPERSVLVVSYATPTIEEPLVPVTIADDKRAPSSAHRKVEEAFALMRDEPRSGETVADLGAAPGGWSYAALKRGARVTAVDRADLLEPVASQVTHLRKDAFAWEPGFRFDWLLCDAIAVPDKTIALVDRWLEKKWARKLVVNLKFKGLSDYGKIDKLRAVLSRHGARARVKQLQADKNEVTAFGFARLDAP